MRPKQRCRHAREFAGDFLIGLVVFLAVLALAALDSRAARSATILAAQQMATEAPPLSLENVTAGTLFLRPRAAPAGKDGPGPAPAERLDTNIDITVTGPIARATVTQRFRNTGKGWAEAIYAFPLPEAAAVDTLTMQIGKRTVKGVITPREDVRRIYQTARNAGRMANPPALHRPEVFVASAESVGPGEHVTVTIEYQETLQRAGDDYRLRFPLAATPHYAPRSGLHPVKLEANPRGANLNPPVSVKTGAAVNPVSLQVRLNSGFPLGKVHSTTHEITMRRTGEETAVLALARAQVPADRDFELTWRRKDGGSPRIAAFQETAGDNAYVLAMLAPPDIEAAPAPLPRSVTFVIDASASMAGASIDQAKESLALALSRLQPGDRFNIIRFGSGTDKLFDAPASVTRESLAVGTHYLFRLEARGESGMLPALQIALENSRKQEKRIRQIILISDGAAANDTELLAQLAAERGRARLFMVGIGPVPNSFLMRRAAEIGRGSYVHIADKSQVLDRLNRLFERLERPVVTDLKLEWASGMRADVWPKPLPDLYAGEPIVIAAQLSALKGDLKISGTVSGKPWTQSLSLSHAKQGDGTASFWARQKIASLEARRYAGQTAGDVNAAIEAVALEHGLLSRMTGLILVEASPALPKDKVPASEDLPASFPAGWVHGTMLEMAAEEQEGPGLMRTAALPSRSASAAKPSSARMTNPDPPDGRLGIASEISPPKPNSSKTAFKSGGAATGLIPSARTTGSSGRIWTLSVMALLFAAMTALTLGLWRHLRHSVAPERGRGERT